MFKAQVSMEALMAVIILFVFFVVSLGLLSEINANAFSLNEQAAQWNECTKIARLAEEVFVQGPGTQAKAVFSLPFSVSARSVYMGDATGATCDFTAAVRPGSVLRGTVVFSNSSGVVVVKNA